MILPVLVVTTVRGAFGSGAETFAPVPAFCLSCGYEKMIVHAEKLGAEFSSGPAGGVGFGFGVGAGCCAKAEPVRTAAIAHAKMDKRGILVLPKLKSK